MADFVERNTRAGPEIGNGRIPSTADALAGFHPIVREWFERRFGGVTAAQAGGWPAIAGGRHTLISAPTGSGKTLAAFMICIDGLLRAALTGELEDRAQVVYVSPLKALSNDVHKNLSLPLREICQLARDRGLSIPEIRIAVRTGDTSAYERQSTARKPPHIWVTTPESFYILLTSPSGRRGLEGVRTIILDEIHAVAGNKRGSHLSLSVERLCALTQNPITRIGLSATQHPIEEVARFLVGTANINPVGSPDCTMVDIGRGRTVDLQIEIPGEELSSIAGQKLWDNTIARIAELIEAHRTTLVFVNTRRLVERVAHFLSQKLGDENVVAHHGSLSRKTRLRAEERLKSGEVKVCVATSSLELGIDIGAVDLVCQIASPRSISILLQRVGRSDHRLGGVPKGRLFPLTRDELIECAALLFAARRGILDQLSIPPWPLDTLAQQIVAMCSAEPWEIERLFRTVCAAYPYRDLQRGAFDRVIDMLAEGIPTALGRRAAHLYYDRVHGMLRPRRGARLTALTNGGAIPDNADYDVIVEPEGTSVGTVPEDFAMESLVGDVFLLGNTSWRIRLIEKGKVRVEDARGQAPDIPFWLGEAPGRTSELSLLVSQIRERIDERLADRQSCKEWLMREAGLSDPAAEQAWAYIGEGKRMLGSVPALRRIIAERFFDETGGTQLVLHAPLGRRINRACGLVLRRRFRTVLGFELQASATDDGINLSFGPQHSFPLEEILKFLSPSQIKECLEQAVLGSPIFATRWRWTLARALVLARFLGGRRVPAPLQRMRADDLLAAIFPAQASSLGMEGLPEVAIPDHPLVFETLRDCLHEALDAEGLRRTLESLENGEIEFFARDTAMPSVFSHQILNAMPYAFLDDAPLEERRARTVILRRTLPDQADELGRLDPEAIRNAAQDAWPEPRNADELHDLLIGLQLFPESESLRLGEQSPLWMSLLTEDGRARKVEAHDRCYWVAGENWEKVRSLAGFASSHPEPAIIPAGRDPFCDVIRGWVEVSGPLTPDGLASLLGFAAEAVRAAMIQLESEGIVLRGFFSGTGEEEFCDRRILARIHRATLARLRREIEPVPASAFLSFLFDWQHITPGSQLDGEHGVLQVVEQLQGFEAAAAAWEEEILRARIRDYKPEFLDSLCLAGEVAWGRLLRRATRADVPSRRPGLTRTAPLSLALREDLPWLLADPTSDEEALSHPARLILELLRHRGASFFPELIAGTRCLPAQVEEALWQLVAAGLVTADSYGALRSLVSGETKRQERSKRRRRQPRATREGRWSLWEPAGPAPENRIELWVRQYLCRYGVICREVLSRESLVPPWREFLYFLRRAEARGEIRGGRFIAGLTGEQFALPEAVEALRALRRKDRRGILIRVSACDPLNLVGIITPGPRIASVLGNRIVYRDGAPVAVLDNGVPHIVSQVEADELPLLTRLLDPRPASAFAGDDNP